MPIYMISYDLHSPTNNREKVERDIESLGPWCKYVSTTYLVTTSSNLDSISAIAIRNLDSNDRMVISKVEKPIKGWLSDRQWNWIKKNL